MVITNTVGFFRGRPVPRVIPCIPSLDCHEDDVAVVTSITGLACEQATGVES